MNQPIKRDQYAYRRHPSSHVYTSTFNPLSPPAQGHSHSMQHTHGNPYAPATTVLEAKPVTTVSNQSSSSGQQSSGGLLSNFSLSNLTKYANVDELKGLVDRFGGLDGILATVTKVQKVVSTVGQIAPMAKIFSGVLGKGGNSNNNNRPSNESVVTAKRRPAPSKSKGRRGRRVKVNRQSNERQRRSQVYMNKRRY